jgi:hypothetical protein
MTWLTWRQNRFAAAGMLLVVLVLSACFLYLQVEAWAVRGPAHDSVASGVAARRLGNLNGLWSNLQVALQVLPVLAGLFIGAPLVAEELETGTHRLVWTQSVGRRRWLLSKLALVLLPSMACAVIVAVFSQQTAAALSSFNLWGAFDVVGVAFVAYVVFSLALGITAGALIGRLLPAMVVTLFGFVLARFVVTQERPRFMPPLTVVWHPLVGPAAVPAGAWEFKYDFASQQLATIYYQPAERFWAFQAIEGGIFFGLAVLLLALATRWLLRHTS